MIAASKSAGTPGSVFSASLLVTTCVAQLPGLSSGLTQTRRFIDLLPAPRPAIAARSGSCAQSAAPNVTVVPLRSGQDIGVAPQTFGSARLQICTSGAFRSPRLTSLSGSLAGSASWNCRRAWIAFSAAPSRWLSQMPCSLRARSHSRFTAPESATVPAGGVPCACRPQDTDSAPADPALVPCRKNLLLGYFANVYWIAALVASRPFTVRPEPSGSVFRLFGSGLSPPE